MTRLCRKFALKSVIQQWEKVRFLVGHGFLFYPIRAMIEPGVFAHVSYPTTLSEAKVLVEKYKSQAPQ
jgi:hypothetical protein